MRTLKFFILVSLAMNSMMAHAYTVGGYACKQENAYKLIGYFQEKSSSIYQDLPEEDVLNKVFEGMALDNVQKGLLIELLHSAPIKYGQKLRLQNAPSHCEGIFYIPDNGSIWISGDVFDTLKPYEKIAVYFEIMEQWLSPSSSSELLRKKAWFRLSTDALSSDMTYWINKYHQYIGGQDNTFYFFGHYYLSFTLRFSEEGHKGTLSSYNNSTFIEDNFLDLERTIVTAKENFLSEIVFPGPTQIKTVGGIFRALWVKLNEDQTIKCTKLWKPAILKTIEGTIDVFPENAVVCFEGGYVATNFQNTAAALIY